MVKCFLVIEVSTYVSSCSLLAVSSTDVATGLVTVSHSTMARLDSLQEICHWCVQHAKDILDTAGP